MGVGGGGAVGGGQQIDSIDSILCCRLFMQMCKFRSYDGGIALKSLVNTPWSSNITILIRPLWGGAEREGEREGGRGRAFKANPVNSTHSGLGECNSTSLILH